jgi:DNA polymerase bacteriophage-type
LTRLVLDFETASPIDLTRAGPHAYAEDIDTQITVLCFAVDNGPIETWIQGPPPPSFLTAIQGGAVVVAHNYLFEFCLYHAKLVPQGWPPIPIGQWSCTMARALVAGFPASLDFAAVAAGLTHRKDKAARELMLRMARPRTRNPLTWWHQTDPAKFARLCAYCVQDVEVERELDGALPDLSCREQDIFEADFWLNMRGLRVDIDMVDRLQSITKQERGRLDTLVHVLTGGIVDGTDKVARLVKWLAGEGVAMASLAREAVEDRLLLALPDQARAALQARLDASRASTAKLTAIHEARSSDGRVRLAFQYYGAGRTGRWAGRRIQPQNLPRGVLKDPDAALALVASGADAEALQMLYADSPMTIVASCIRGVIEAPAGHLLVVCDLAQIEARVLCWITGETAKLDVFRRGEDVYTYTAARIGSPSRLLGKVLELACGFGMGLTTFLSTAKTYRLELTHDQADDAVHKWRRENPKIVRFWHDFYDACRNIVAAPAGSTLRYSDRFRLFRTTDALLVRLPSGRCLVYREPVVEPGPHGRPIFTYMGSLGGNWVRLRSWPGLATENVVQAIARDVMCEAMILLHKLDVPLIATIHDELIAEVPIDEAPMTLRRMRAAMTTPVPWAPGLPLDAKGFVLRRYRKD